MKKLILPAVLVMLALFTTHLSPLMAAEGNADFEDEANFDVYNAGNGKIHVKVLLFSERGYDYNAGRGQNQGLGNSPAATCQATGCRLHTKRVSDNSEAIYLHYWADNYYNNTVYGSWQHAGHVMGIPTLISPLYNNDGSLSVYHNRVKAHHVGLCGEPCSQFAWRFLYTHDKSWGTYDTPTKDPLYGNFYLVEATWKPRRVRGLSITGSYGHNDGTLLGESNGAMLTLRYSGWLNSTH